MRVSATRLGALSLLPAIALASAPSIPDTPVGNALRSWLQVFNSGESARIDSFDRAHAPWLTLGGMMQRRARTGGYDLLSIEGSGRFWIVFRARERTSSAKITGSMVVRSYEPDHITLLSFMPAAAHPTEVTLDEGERTRVVDGAARLLNEYYLFPDSAKRVSLKLEALQRHHEYRGITDGEIFAARLSDDLVALSGDKHIGVDFFPRSMPPKPAPHPRPGPRGPAPGNCGIEKVAHLPHNIGYLQLSFFARPGYCTRPVIGALSSLAGSNALIIDLRDNHGGAPQMVALIASFLFGKRTHLDDIDSPRTDSREQLWTDARWPGKRFTGKPVFVLTSSSTFSAAEEFGYDLQSLKRATVVGETTGGGAHLEAPHRIDAHFFIRIPFARFVNPITGTDWEGSGVRPDVSVSAAQALAAAEKLAAEAIARTGAAS
jgi:Peptidase family S41/N-terminal domain of Peptidase_S41 in eukaryotic IRBP